MKPHVSLYINHFFYHPTHVQHLTSQVSRLMSLLPRLTSHVFLLITLISSVLHSTAQEQISNTPPKKLQVYFILDPACPISQQYTVEIKRLNTLYRKDGIEMSLVFPFSGQKKFKKSTKDFLNTYQLEIPSMIDRHLSKTKKLQATVTPEAFLIKNDNQILYHGAIDDWFYALGKNRKEATAHYLEDAINAAIQNKPILTAHVKAVGCLIELDK